MKDKPIAESMTSILNKTTESFAEGKTRPDLMLHFALAKSAS
jgi:hypothetical protein